MRFFCAESILIQGSLPGNTLFLWVPRVTGSWFFGQRTNEHPVTLIPEGLPFTGDAVPGCPGTGRDFSLTADLFRVRQSVFSNGTPIREYNRTSTMLTVLYVDDEPSLLEITKLFLELEGDFTVTTALSAPEGLQALGRIRFDAVISDYQMPGMDGILFLKEVRKQFGDIPFILFTGKGREDVVVQAINNGVDFYLQKGGDAQAQFAELSHKLRAAVERRQALYAVKDSERRLSDIINFLPDATFAIDTGGRVIAWNKAIEEMTGVSAAEMMGKDDYAYAVPFYGDRCPILIDMVSLSDEELLQHHYSVANKEGDTLVAETSFPHPRDMPKTLFCKASLLYDKNGSIAGAIESIRDITESKRIEKSLHDNEEIFRRTFDQSPAGAALVSLDFRFQRVNEALCRILGYSEDELRSRTFAEITYPDHLAADRSGIGRLQTGEIAEYSTEKRYIRKDGGIVWAETSVRLIKDATGQPLVYLPIIIDISRRKKSEDDLRAMYEQVTTQGEELRTQYDALAQSQRALAVSEEKFRTILENIQDVYYRTDAGGILIMISPSGAVLLGYASPEEMIGRAATDFYSDPAQRERLLAALKDDRAVFNVETSLRRRDGTSVIVSTSSHVYYDKDGNYAGIEGIFRDITRFKQIQEELRQSEEKYRILIDHSQNGIFLAQDGILLFCNRAFSDMIGYTPAEVRGKPITDLIAPEDRSLVLDRHLRRLAGTTLPESYEFRLLHKDATTRVFVSMSVGTTSYRGRTATTGSIRDITREREREIALQKSEEKFRTIVETSPDMVWEIDPRGLFSYISPQCISILGYTPEYLVGKSLFCLIPPDSVPDVSAALAEHQGNKAGFMTVDVNARHKDGRRLIVNIRSAPVLDDTGTITGFRGIASDITERKLRENALRESEELHKKLLTTIPDIIVRTTPDGIITFINDQGVTLYGQKSPEAFVGKPMLAFFAPEEIPAVMENMLLMFERPLGPKVYQVLRQDGTRISLEVNGDVLRTAEGNPYGLVFVCRDITERKKGEEDLKRANQKLTLLSDITRHDVLNKISVLLGTLALAKKKSDNATMGDFITRIESAAKAIREQIEFTRVYQEIGTLKPQWQSPDQIIRRSWRYPRR